MKCVMLASLFVSAAFRLYKGDPSSIAVVKSQYDHVRIGTNPYKTQFIPANVNVCQFGKVWLFSVDSDVYAQPLYLLNVTISGISREG